MVGANREGLNRSILRLAIPNIISNITVPLLGLVDMMLMGHLDSVVYIGAIGLGGTIFSVMYSIFSFMRAGTTGFTAQAYGADDHQEISYAFYRSMCIALIATLLVLSLQRPIEWIAMQLLNGSDEVLRYTSEYFRVRIWAAPAVLSLYTFNGWYIGMQNTTIPMTIAILINVVNIGLSVLFVNVFHMGVAGVALGTVIAQYTGLLTAIVFMLAKYRRYLVRIQKAVLLQADKLKRFFRVNTDFMIRSILLVLTIAFFTNQSAKLGDDILAVNMILMQFFYIFSYFTDGFAYAGEALVGRFTGARDQENLKRTIRYLFWWGLGLTLPFTILYWAFPETFIHLISDQPGVVEQARPYYIYMVLIPVITFAAFLWDGIYIGATAAREIRNTMLIASLLVFLPAWFFLMPMYGNHGLWIAFLLFMVARGVSMTVMAKRIWRPKSI
ncbi:MAG: MATE family efflux transporter [Bacteroidales bacterium]|nr:MATE family efflux transporter [Bacteroidales bacterium]